jgi:hypothetical protein
VKVAQAAAEAELRHLPSIPSQLGTMALSF